MIIQTAPPGTPRLAIMMYEHTALCGQFARAFGNASRIHYHHQPGVAGF
jgi:hypothetical protein